MHLSGRQRRRRKQKEKKKKNATISTRGPKQESKISSVKEHRGEEVQEGKEGGREREVVKNMLYF